MTNQDGTAAPVLASTMGEPVDAATLGAIEFFLPSSGLHASILRIRGRSKPRISVTMLDVLLVCPGAVFTRHHVSPILVPLCLPQTSSSYRCQTFDHVCCAGRDTKVRTVANAAERTSSLGTASGQGWCG